MCLVYEALVAAVLGMLLALARVLGVVFGIFDSSFYLLDDYTPENN